MNTLENKTVILTGALGLLGKAFARACALEGAKLVLVDIQKKEGEEFARTLADEVKNENVAFAICDISRKDELKEMVDKTSSRFGSIDALVNNAYPRNKNYGKPFEEITYEDFCENVNMHLGGYMLATQQVLPLMKKQKSGTIIFMASIYGFAAPRFEIYKGTKMTMPAEYAAIKGALLTLTKYLASYLGEYGIRVNAVSPGGIFNNQDPVFVKAYSSHVPFGKRMANPDDIVGALLFLLSDASLYITGQNIVVDGGWSITS